MYVFNVVYDKYNRIFLFSIVANIEVTKPERAKMLVNILIANIQRGAIRSKLSEEELKSFLGQVNEQIAKKQTTVKVSNVWFENVIYIVWFTL